MTIPRTGRSSIPASSNPFHADELALLVDRKGKHYLVRLRAGGTFHFHQGIVQHDHVIGHDEGTCLRTTLDRPVWAYRPRLRDYVMEMPRTSAIIYPKDIAFLLMWADIFPGARVFEAGAGSGALAIAILRSIGPAGSLVTYDLRPDMIASARANAEAFLDDTSIWTLRCRDVYAGIDDGPFDRIVLDVPEPGRAAPHAGRALVAGGMLCSFVPNVNQVEASVQAYRACGQFTEIETYEATFRPWLFRGPSARPVASNLGHTGFLTFARKRTDSCSDTDDGDAEPLSPPFTAVEARGPEGVTEL